MITGLQLDISIYSVRSVVVLHDFIADSKCLPQMEASSYRKHTQVKIEHTYLITS